eukprot:CAMPEP_0204075474 /NCGR_PEP_ID=MMETSP0360-20130528/166378_1 /ASSEMBLY_ACC=CAM_ASM_000342 /TAXON_ID=268821 /ORGANISM="Scrippsiella Hangoei, Strain SHTV-5" /LENGTH=41 /DNA_ID= /DNA_START= /DNA_END= /DNA_ORIENTATION=
MRCLGGQQSQGAWVRDWTCPKWTLHAVSAAATTHQVVRGAD